MDNESLLKRILHLREVEKLSLRQIGKELDIDRKKVCRILKQSEIPIKPIERPKIITPFKELIAEWYRQRPYLKATQVYERLQSYGFVGSYPTVVVWTSKYRKKKEEVYHTLEFLPGQEAQVDWFFFNHKLLGQMAGFVYILSYSRYAWGMFYPKTSFEFFLAGHIECFRHIGGLAHCHRYDNLKSVILKHTPEIEYNPQFLDFARFYGFSIYVCNPYKGNEKGRVERIIRDIHSFLYAEDFIDIDNLNRKFHLWLDKRNNTIHRSTDKTPKELLIQERLISLPEASYAPRRVIQAMTSKTALVEFETNKYSLPSTCASKGVEIIAYPERIEISLAGKKIATHTRCFGKRQTIQNPLHAEKLLERTPRFKMQRILQLITNMDLAFKHFLDNQDNDTQRIDAAYQLFVLLKSHSRPMLTSAVRELNTLSCFKIRALRSLLQLPESKEYEPLWPQNQNLLNLTYKERSLNDYDLNSTSLGTT